MKRCIVLENIRSAYNVGTIIRTAEGIGFNVITSGFSPPTTHPKVQKTALGAQEHIQCQHITDVHAATVYVRDTYDIVIGAEYTSHSTPLEKRYMHTIIPSYTHTTPSIAVIVGNEITGISMGTRTAVDNIVHIPMCGHKSSYNVAVAAGILMYRIACIAL